MEEALRQTYRELDLALALLTSISGIFSVRQAPWQPIPTVESSSASSSNLTGAHYCSC